MTPTNKLTNTDITAIDTALKNMFIEYADIRFELIDHIATVLEADENSGLDYNAYIKLHKKELKKLNSKFTSISNGKSFKALLANLLSIKFLMLFGAIFLAALGVNKLFGIECSACLLFVIYGAFTVSAILQSTIKSAFRKIQYSPGQIFNMPSAAFVFLAIQIIPRYEAYNQTLVLLYFTAITALSITVYFTARQLKNQYKLRYHA